MKNRVVNKLVIKPSKDLIKNIFNYFLKNVKKIEKNQKNGVGNKIVIKPSLVLLKN
jgi:hypothetical protein